MATDGHGFTRIKKNERTPAYYPGESASNRGQIAFLSTSIQYNTLERIVPGTLSNSAFSRLVADVPCISTSITT